VARPISEPTPENIKLVTTSGELAGVAPRLESGCVPAFSLDRYQSLAVEGLIITATAIHDSNALTCRRFGSAVTCPFAVCVAATDHAGAAKFGD
jgi:hypothetical protein